MNRSIIIQIARHYWKSLFKTKSIYAVIAMVVVILCYAAYSGFKSYTVQNDIRSHYQQMARQSWESNPDKHPHRMAHYGSFAFRLRHPLSMFDFGMESFTGNAVYLEAHKQNTVNFSEASFSTGLLRFGEISMAMLLQSIIPLAIFFLGFAAIATERENGTLKILLTQGAGWKEILAGKSLGIMGVAMLFFIPVAVVAGALLIFCPAGTDGWIRYIVTMVGYTFFYAAIAVITAVVSATSPTAKDSLIRLLGIWLFFVILMPKTTQALGKYIYPAPARVAFEAAIEQDVIRQGDSHNPDDPHYKAIKDSLLRAYRVDSVQQLPFNYSGFVMREGERLSAAAYNHHLTALLQTYHDQNSLTRITALVNPYIAIRNISMALSGTDFISYVDFQKQAEAYRYNMAQAMNEFQMEYISNEKPAPGAKPHTISHEHWKEFPDFQHRFLPIATALRSEAWSIASLVLWVVASIALIVILSKKIKAI